MKVYRDPLARSALACLMAILTISVPSAKAQDDPKSALNRAERLAILRDQMVTDYSGWSEEYAGKRTAAAQKQKAQADVFLRMVRADTGPSVARPKRKGLSLKYVCMSGLKRPGYEGKSSNTVLKLSTGQLFEGPVVGALTNASAEEYSSFMSNLITKVSESGDLALLEISVLVPSGRYANLGGTNIQYFADEDLSGRIRQQGPTCLAQIGDAILIETADKKYALVQLIGKYQGEALLCIAYQPNGSAVFHFGSITKPKGMDYKKQDLDPKEVATAMFIFNRETFYWNEFRAVARGLRDIADEKIQGADIGQTKKAKQLIKQLGIEESTQPAQTDDMPNAETP